MSSSQPSQESSVASSSEKTPSRGYIRGAPDAAKRKLTDPLFHEQALWAFVSIILALLVAAVIMAMAGYDAGQAYAYLLIGAIREPDRVMQFATPLILTGLSVALAFKCGLFNIGAEGQLYFGSIAAAVVGFSISLPFLVHPILCLAVGAIVGAAYGFVPGVLKAYRGAHEVVTTMMLSYAAVAITTWLVGTNGPWQDPAGSQLIPQTPLLQDTAILPTIGGPYMHWGLLVALLAVFGVDFLINRTVLGFEMRAVGLNQDAAEYAGINAKRNMALALTISGGLSGLAGAEEVMGTYNRFIHHWSPGLGWDGITVAVLGSNSPWGVLGGAIFFAALRVGGNSMQLNAHVPIEMVSVIQGLVVLFVAAPKIVSWMQRQSIDYAAWARESEGFPIDHLLGTLLSVVGVFISFGLASSGGGGMAATGALFFVGLITIAGFGMFLSRNPSVIRIQSIVMASWLVTALVGLLFGEMVIAAISGIMGILCMIDLLMLRRSGGIFEMQGGAT